jgi:tight adherence protein C
MVTFAGSTTYGALIPIGCLGLALTLLFWWFVRYLQSVRQPELEIESAQGANTVSAARRLNGSHRLVFRLCHVVGTLLAPLTPRACRLWIQRLIREAGLDWLLRPETVIAGQLLLSGCVFFLLFALHKFIEATPLIALVVCVLAWAWPLARLSQAARDRRQSIARDLPTYLDLLVLAVSGGQSTAAAIAMAVKLGPPGPLADELTRMLREVRAGRPRQEAMHAMSTRLNLNGVKQATGALIAAERQGADITEVLKAQADQRRQERFLDAEQRAMKAPVRMLLPLVVFIFPGTFLVLMFPVAVQLLNSGLL